MSLLRILPAAEADILEVRAKTLADFGPVQLAEYDELLEDPLEALAENPRAGRPRPEIAPHVFSKPPDRQIPLAQRSQRQ